MIRKIIKLILIILWMGIIFSFSSDTGTKSTSKSDKIIIKVYKIFNSEKLTNKEKQKIIDKFVFPVRKAAHFTEYLILGILVISFINEFKIIDIRSIIIAIIICMLYAVSDEIHQLFSSGRTAKLLDVLIDSLGSISGILIYSYIMNIFHKIKE